MLKDQIRKDIKKQRNLLSIQERDCFSNAILERLFQSIEYKNCSYLFPFISFGTEVNTWEIIRKALLDQKRIYVPRVESHGLEFYEIHNLEGLIRSKFGVPEPLGIDENRYRKVNCKKNHQEDIHNLMLLPGLAFDSYGNRIGYGAGYYDSYLSTYPTKYFYKMAVAYDFQLMEQIPSEEYDIKVDTIMTPTKRIQCMFI